jgi:hypothetical protein
MEIASTDSESALLADGASTVVDVDSAAGGPTSPAGATAQACVPARTTQVEVRRDTRGARTGEVTRDRRSTDRP